MSGRVCAEADLVLLVAADREVRHHDIMDLWSTLRARGIAVKLGAAPEPTESEEETS